MPCSKSNAAKKRNEARPPLGSAAEAPRDHSAEASWQESPGTTPNHLEALDDLIASLPAASARGDLQLARDLLMAAMIHTFRADPTRLPPIVKELRATWKALGDTVEEGEDDEFTRALKAREAARAAGA